MRTTTGCPEKCAALLEEFDAHPAAGMVHHRQKELDARTGEFRDGAFTPLNGNLAATKESILTFNPTAMSSLAFRKSILEGVLPIPEAITIQADGYIQALALFLASVVAIDEPLGVYRFHGSNLYFLSQAEKDKKKNKETRRRRAVTLRAIVEGLEGWFRSHDYDLARPTVRTTLRRWTTLLEREEFAISPPGRLRFFRHLLETNRNHFPVMTWKLWLINYFNAAGSLVVGYEHFDRLDELRGCLTRWAGGRASKGSGPVVPGHRRVGPP